MIRKLYEKWGQNWVQVERENGRFVKGSNRKRVTEMEVGHNLRKHFKKHGWNTAILVNKKKKITRMPIYIDIRKAQRIFNAMQERSAIRRKARGKSPPPDITLVREDFGWTYQYGKGSPVYVSKFGAYFVRGSDTWSMQAWMIADILYRRGAKNEGRNILFKGVSA